MDYDALEQDEDFMKILVAADGAYPDGLVLQAFHALQGNGDAPGDTLAEFVVREIADTYDAEADWEDKVTEAQRVMENAAMELESVSAVLYDMLRTKSMQL